MHKGLKPDDHFRQVQGAGEAEEVAQAEEHDPVGRHAEHDVLDGRFHLAPLARALTAHRHEQVEREGRQLQGDDQRDDVDAAHQHDEPGDAQGDEEVVLGFDLVADVGEVAAQENDTSETGGKHEFEPLGERVDAVGAAEEIGLGAEGEHGGDDGGEREPEGRGAGPPRPRVTDGDGKETQRAGQQHQFRKKSQDEAGGHHQGRLPTCCRRCCTLACMTLTNGAGWRPIQKTKTSNGARARISRTFRSVRPA